MPSLSTLQARFHNRRILERRQKEEARSKPAQRWCMIDGEGKTIGEPWYLEPTGGCVLTGESHLYTTMSWRSVDREGFDIVDNEGLTTEQCLDFILSIPPHFKICAYGFGYDLTKILEGIPTNELFRLTHPETRRAEFQADSGGNGIRYAPVH